MTETRDVNQVVPSGTDVSWAVQLTNKSTQVRELLSIEMPHAARLIFTLVGRQPTPDRPIKLQPGDKHTQQIKFNDRKAADQDHFRHSMMFNFSNWLLEHELNIRVAHPAALATMQLLEPQRPYVKPVLPEVNEPSRHCIPCLFNRSCALPGVALYESVSVYSGAVPLGEYELPGDMAALIDGSTRPPGAASFNPWKTRQNYRKRLHEMLFLEEAHQAKLTRAYDLRGVEVERVDQYADGDTIRFCTDDPLTRVPCANLGEKRPSVQVADRVYAWRSDGAADCEWEGFVHRIEQDALLVLFAQQFHAKISPGTRVHMRFDT